MRHIWRVNCQPEKLFGTVELVRCQVVGRGWKQSALEYWLPETCLLWSAHLCWPGRRLQRQKRPSPLYQRKAHSLQKTTGTQRWRSHHPRTPQLYDSTIWRDQRKRSPTRRLAERFCVGVACSSRFSFLVSDRRSHAVQRPRATRFGSWARQTKTGTCPAPP